MALRPRRARTDLIALTAMCAVVYAVGLTTHGLTNWQEAQRALVAREMHEAGSWIVPISAGVPYLSKPPLIYWCELALATAFGRTPGELELRLTVALAGWLGVIATYVVTRRLLAEPDADEGRRGWADHAAWWSSLMLLTGVLYVRSSRVGELDILLVAPTVVGIGAIHAAWVTHARQNRTNWGANVLAIACGVLCALAKGPPGIVTLVLGGYGGVVLASLRARREAETRRSRVGCVWKALSRTHPILVVIVPLFVLWLWMRGVAAEIGPGAVQVAMAREASENLRLFILESPIKNLEAMSYGVGVGSVAAIIALVWLIKDRPRLPMGWLFVASWVILPFIAFSVLGKGVGRYLTPMWPAIAMAGGLWLASLRRDKAWGVHVTRVAYLAVVVLAIGQAWWYGYGREQAFSDRSPRGFMQELLRPELGVQAERIAALDFWTPALDYYAGHGVEPVYDVGPEIEHPSRESLPLAEVVSRLRASGATMTMLVRETPHPSTAPVDPIERLHRAGLATATIPLAHDFVIDNRHSRVLAVRIWAVAR